MPIDHILLSNQEHMRSMIDLFLWLYDGRNTFTTSYSECMGNSSFASMFVPLMTAGAPRQRFVSDILQWCCNGITPSPEDLWINRLLPHELAIQTWSTFDVCIAISRRRWYTTSCPRLSRSMELAPYSSRWVCCWISMAISIWVIALNDRTTMRCRSRRLDRDAMH